jgi:hypothetical protein
MLKEHSTSNQEWAEEDTSTLLEETLSSRPQMEEAPKNGTSIKHH